MLTQNSGNGVARYEEKAGASAPRPPRAVVINAVTMNGGDTAILFAVIEQIRLVLGPDVHVTVLDLVGTGAQRYYPNLELEASTLVMGEGRESRIRRQARAFFRLLATATATTAMLGRAPRDWVHAAAPDWLRRRLSLFEQADLVVATGGTYLVEHYHLLPKLIDVFLANALGRPVVFFTQSLGPFKRRHSRALVRAALAPARLVLLRDHRSLEHLKEAGLDTRNCAVRPDAVFATADAERVRASIGKHLPQTGRRVAISVRAWKKFSRETPEAGMRRYTGAVAALCRHLVDREGATITFLSTCQGIPEYEQKDDRVAESIVASLPPEYRRHISVDAAFHDPRDLVHLLGGFDVVVSTRMHLGILALVAGKPVLPIAYEWKTQELFARLGFARWVTDIDTVDSATLCETYDRLCSEVDGERPELARAVLSCIDDARSVPELLRRVLGRSNDRVEAEETNDSPPRARPSSVRRSITPAPMTALSWVTDR
jgi:colanic acid/amylovoran biosynthesis protein